MGRGCNDLIFHQLLENKTMRYYFTLTRMTTIKKFRYDHVLLRMWVNGNPHPLLVGV